MKILVVCLGNICRSPLAEGLLRREVERRGLDWEIASGGTAGYHVGNPPDPRSVAIARDHGLNISGQRSHRVTAEDLAYYDVVFAMDRQNAADLKQRAKHAADADKVALFLTFAGLEATAGPDVFDPYWDDGGFAGVFAVLDKAAHLAVEKLLMGD